MGIFDRLKGGIITNPEVFSYEYRPEKVVHRDKELEQLARIFQPIFQAKVSASAIVTGPVGTGKTLLARELGRELENHGRGVGKNIKAVHVNARLKKTDNGVLHAIVCAFQTKFPDRGFSFNEMLRILKEDLKKEAAHLVVVIDEADVLVRRSSELIYTLSRINEDDDTRGTVSLLLVSQAPILSYLDAAARDTFKSNLVSLKPYTAEQLVDILQERVEKGLKPGSIAEEELELIGDAAASTGSARAAIEMLETAARCAEELGLDNITAECVRKAAASMTQIDTRVLDLDEGPRAVLLAAARLLKSSSYTYTGELESEYRQLCEELGMKPVGHTQFWNYLKRIETWGLINTKIGRKGMSGNTTVVYLRDMPAEELEKLLYDSFR